MFGRRRLRQLQAENDALREALAYYADVRHWQRRGANAKGEPRRWIKSRVSVDRGDRARHALAGAGLRAERLPIVYRLRRLLGRRGAPQLYRPTVPAALQPTTTTATE